MVIYMFKFKKDKLPDNWKEKSKERSLENKKLKKRIKELSKNRDKWKGKASRFKDLYEDELKKTLK